MLVELLTKGPPAALMLAAAAWGFYQVYKAIRESRSSSVIDVVSIAQLTQEQLNQERTRTDALYSQVQRLNAENVKLYTELRQLRANYEAHLAELRAELLNLRKRVDSAG